MQKRSISHIATLPVTVVLPATLLALVVLANASILPRRIASITQPAWHLLAGFVLTSSTGALQARFTALLPAYVLAICLHVMLRPSSVQHPVATPLLSLILPVLPANMQYPPTSEPVPLPTLIPAIVISSAALPTLLDVLPRAGRSRFSKLCAFLFLALLACFAQRYHALQNQDFPRSLLDLTVYVPFRIFAPAFITGVVLSRIYQSARLTMVDFKGLETCRFTPFFLRGCALVSALLMCGILILPHPWSTYAPELMLIPLSVHIICTSYLSVISCACSRHSSSTLFDNSLSNDIYRSSSNSIAPEMECGFLLGLSAYVSQNIVWRVLGDLLCSSDGGSVPPVCIRSFPEWLGSADQVSRAFPFRTNLRPAFPIFVLSLGFVSCILCYALIRPALQSLEKGGAFNFLQSSFILPTWYTGLWNPSVDASSQFEIDSRPARSPSSAHGTICSLRSLCNSSRVIAQCEAVLKVVLYLSGMFAFMGAAMHLSTPLTYRAVRSHNPSMFCLMPDFLYKCASSANMVTGYQPLSNFTFSLFCIDVLRWISVSCLPAMIFNILGHIVFPRILWQDLPSVEDMISASKAQEGEHAEDISEALQNLDMDFVLFVRYVTRGNNPRLVARNARDAAIILRRSGLTDSRFMVEIVTDKSINLDENDLINSRIVEIVVPAGYKPVNGALFKARALNYAITVSSARDFDWIVHLDEETRFDSDTVAAVMLHCGRQTHAVRVGKMKQWPNIGQGPILFGPAMLSQSSDMTGNSECRGNWITTLADSSRVADDCGRYRTQYECGEVWVGMHGSFVVAANCVEKLVTFDHGVEGSIAEDAFFAMLARSRDVRFSWIDAFMYEQSPFTIIDFIKQRARWLVGGIKVCWSKKIPFHVRAGMASLTGLWAMMPFCYLSLMVCLILEQLEPLEMRDQWYFGVMLPLMASISLWNYTFGFMVTFSVRELGLFRFVTLLYLQLALTPLYGVMEVSAVMYALWNFAPLSVGFHVVQKETDFSQTEHCEDLHFNGRLSTGMNQSCPSSDERTPLLSCES